MEELVSFETAKMAKEKGFDDICYYIQRDELDGTVSEVTKLSDIDLKPARNSICARNDYMIPAQPHLQKWLRNVHNLHITIELYSGKRWIFYVWGYSASIDLPFTSYDVFKTYEEALENSLQKALTLIGREQ